MLAMNVYYNSADIDVYNFDFFEIIQSFLTKYEKILWYQTMFKIYCIVANAWYYKTKQTAIGDMNTECIKILMKFKRKQSLNILRY